VIKKPRRTRNLKPTTGLWKIKPQRFVAPGKQTNKEVYAIHTEHVIMNPWVYGVLETACKAKTPE
jgi:hypothetical protein